MKSLGFQRLGHYPNEVMSLASYSSSFLGVPNSMSWLFLYALKLGWVE